MTCRFASAILLSVCVGGAGCARDHAARSAEYLSRADAYAAQHKYAESRIEYLNAIKEQPETAGTHFKLGQTDLALRNYGEALAEFGKAASLDPANADAMLECASLLLMAGDFRDARVQAERAIEAQPRNANAHILLGDALAGLNDVPQALKKIQDAIALDPASAPAYSTLGSLQLGTGNAREAGESFERAVALDPKSVGAQLALANYRWAIGDRKGAEQALQHALQLDPSNEIGRRALALLYVNEGRNGDAETQFRTLAAGASDGALALADFYAGTGRIDAAFDVLAKVPKDSSVYRASRQRIAMLDEQRGHHADAMTVANTLVSEKPSDAEAKA